MKTRYSRPLPRCFSRHRKARKVRISGEYDIQLTGGSRLRAKLIVFRGRGDLRRFWRDVLDQELGPRCDGVVTRLRSDVVVFRKGRADRCYVERDPRYFCVVGLCERRLTMETISHEAVHIAFAYAERVKRTSWSKCVRQNREEELAYPTGIASAAIRDALYHGGFFRDALNLKPARS